MPELSLTTWQIEDEIARQINEPKMVWVFANMDTRR